MPNRLIQPVQIRGDGSWVVLIHGVGLDHRMWQQQVTALASCHRVLSYDLLGHGDAPQCRQIRVSKLAEFVAQLDKIFVAEKIRAAHLVGFSLGALIAQAFCLHHADKLLSLSLLSSVYQRSPAQQQALQSRLQDATNGRHREIREAAIERWFTRRFKCEHPEVVTHIEQRLASNLAASFLAAYRVFADSDQALAHNLADIHLPTLVLTGEHDIGSTPAMSQALAASIPHAYAVIVPNAKHLVPLERAELVNYHLTQHFSNAERRSHETL